MQLRTNPKSKLKLKEKARTTSRVDGEAEARLIEVYRMIGAANSRDALRKAEKLVEDYPNFSWHNLCTATYLQPVRGRFRLSETSLLIWRRLERRI
ncbi:hypothetical protein RF819_20865 [Rhodoferax fermentans]|uniref:Uncharacterized protein n=1 Tax=Rhodoferax fermentans TaxID=28066 RepID=A0A1T1AXJ2_RHOFE|nr:hypothetical protein RF819_20865 [Rhodoferax fermentans]